MSPEQEVLFLQWLIDNCGYRDPKPIGGDRYTCYPDYASARAALDAWDGRGEPQGWTRHPASGRRVAPPEGAHDNAGRRVAAGERYVRG
jgi:hypothetical protein